MENLLREATHPYAPLAAPHGTSGVLFTLVGVLVVALLIAAFAWGRRIRSREPGPPHPESQPRLPGGEPVGDSMESRQPEELPGRTTGASPTSCRATASTRGAAARGRTSATVAGRAVGAVGPVAVQVKSRCSSEKRWRLRHGVVRRCRPVSIQVP
ncbi:DUF6479 family protein [Streptomyces lydicamycinicus]|uniref:DUF6479 family protein n=1 Tax=Streptomyces lydicamycinicus TaxID=1546107 RepID=UPI0020353966|nr:DUF6479 family protein [Streptomyces lydicamycinicus]USA04683.1 DUF6479 family protein [Streptomyces lydicamycinicus]